MIKIPTTSYTTAVVVFNSSGYHNFGQNVAIWTKQRPSDFAEMTQLRIGIQASQNILVTGAFLHEMSFIKTQTKRADLIGLVNNQRARFRD